MAEKTEKKKSEIAPILELLKEIIALMKSNDVSEVCIEQEQMKLQVKLRDFMQTTTQFVPQNLSSNMTSSSFPHPLGSSEKSVELKQDKDMVTVGAPIVGTFYRSPAPDEPPYIQIGDKVKEGQPLCIIEAMKLMNEITAEFDGEMVDILAENAQAVEYGQPLFIIKRLKKVEG
jgi:acetyl-CoA carboxylase biotin carboxyl carrier protein